MCSHGYQALPYIVYCKYLRGGVMVRMRPTLRHSKHVFAPTF